MPSIVPVNRPPAIELTQVQPAEPVVTLNPNPACRDEQPVFQVRVRELDTEQDLRVRWFLDYDYGQPDDLGVVPLANYELPPLAIEEADRTLRLSRAFDPLDVRPFEDGRLHTLEIFVVEDDALIEDLEVSPRWRALRTCATDPDTGAPVDAECVSSYPAVFRWTVAIREAECRP